jgi:hypothetical protein
MTKVSVPTSTLHRRRDWFRIIRLLMGAGVSMGDIGRKCGREATTVKHWADGGEPKESDARIVLALFAKHCPGEYAAHQQHFEVRIEIDLLTDQGETRTLPFVD